MGSTNLTTIPLIFDTDMDIDCDDAEPLAILHALMDYGEADILRIICDVPSIDSAFVVTAINYYYNRSEIPIGIVKDANFKTSKKYELYRREQNEDGSFGYYPPRIINEFKQIEFNEENIYNAEILYRKLLSKAD